MVTLIERESKTEIKQGQDNHTDEKRNRFDGYSS